jgi:hypothetical protein
MYQAGKAPFNHGGSGDADTFNKEERSQILAALLDDASPENLRPLTSDETNERLNTIAHLDNGPATKLFRQLRNSYLLALLHTQHEITKIEEEISQGEFQDLDNMRLTELLVAYGTFQCHHLS